MTKAEEQEVLGKMFIKDTLEALVGKRFTKESLEAHLSQKFGVTQTLDDISKDDDELGDWNLLGCIDKVYPVKHDYSVSVYGYYDIYFLKMKQEGFDGNNIYITEIGIEFE